MGRVLDRAGEGLRQTHPRFSGSGVLSLATSVVARAQNPHQPAELLVSDLAPARSDGSNLRCPFTINAPSAPGLWRYGWRFIGKHRPHLVASAIAEGPQQPPFHERLHLSPRVFPHQRHVLLCLSPRQRTQ